MAIAEQFVLLLPAGPRAARLREIRELLPDTGSPGLAGIGRATSSTTGCNPRSSSPSWTTTAGCSWTTTPRSDSTSTRCCARRTATTTAGPTFGSGSTTIRAQRPRPERRPGRTGPPCRAIGGLGAGSSAGRRTGRRQGRGGSQSAGDRARAGPHGGSDPLGIHAAGGNHHGDGGDHLVPVVPDRGSHRDERLRHVAAHGRPARPDGHRRAFDAARRDRPARAPARARAAGGACPAGNPGPRGRAAPVRRRSNAAATGHPRDRAPSSRISRTVVPPAPLPCPHAPPAARAAGSPPRDRPSRASPPRGARGSGVRGRRSPTAAGRSRSSGRAVRERPARAVDGRAAGRCSSEAPTGGPGRSATARDGWDRSPTAARRRVP